ncbi:MAG: lysophospholipid acyltransferase family protein [Acidobacteriota bacterium]|nr:lysophospholipid acyltransferase family protein [Acidobacteriota bacterium]
MLTADKNLWLEKIFAVYNRNLFKRRFSSLQMSGLHFLENNPENTPLVIYANHSSWWDGLTAFQISRRAALDSFIMMEEKQLKKLWFFRKLGAFSVVRENNREALKSINYAIQTLRKNPKRSLWVFPQGEILPNDVRPLRFYNGLARIIKSFEKCSIVCLAMRYEFLGKYKPDIFVKFKNIELSAMELKLKPQEISGILSDHLTGCLNELKAEIVNQNFSDFEQIC